MSSSREGLQIPPLEARRFKLRTGYEIVQRNGQRVYAPSRKIPPPPRGSEVFIGNLPKNMYEDELVPLLESVGPLYQLRLMLDFNSKTRGFAFATYFSKQDAKSAVQRLNGYKVRYGIIHVFKSVDNRRLFVGNLPLAVTEGDVMELLKTYAEGVVSVTSVHRDHNYPHLNRGFVFVEFEDHRLATLARKKLAPDNLEAWGRTLYVNWADPLPEVDPQVMAKVCNLHLRNLPMEYTSERLHSELDLVVGSQLITRVAKIHDYAFVHFVNRRSAELALNRFRSLTLTDWQGFQHPVQVEWARPKRYSKEVILSAPPEHFCTSVSSRMKRMILQDTPGTTAPKNRGN